MGEILKLSVTGGNDLLNIYEQAVTDGKVNNFENYRELILSALAVKRAIIEEDEFEKYYRKSLNYGHTIGHAIEVLSNYKIPHGQAVIIGMLVVNKLALDRGVLNPADYEKVKLLLDDDEKRIELIKKGKEQLKKYTWSGSAKKFHEIINKFRG